MSSVARQMIADKPDRAQRDKEKNNRELLDKEDEARKRRGQIRKQQEAEEWARGKNKRTMKAVGKASFWLLVIFGAMIAMAWNWKAVTTFVNTF